MHAALLPLLAVAAVLGGRSGPLVHTYSIVARDPATGDMGVAVQSHWFSVGSIVSWGRPASASSPRSRSSIPATACAVWS